MPWGEGFPSLLKEGKCVRALAFVEPQCLRRLVEERGICSVSFLGRAVWRAPNPLLEAADPLKLLPPRFPTEIHSGLLEVISPSPHFYPDFSRLRESFGDPKERVRYLCSESPAVSLEDPVWWVGWGLPASGASLRQFPGGGVFSASEAPPPGPQVEDQTEPRLLLPHDVRTIQRHLLCAGQLEALLLPTLNPV